MIRAASALALILAAAPAVALPAPPAPLPFLPSVSLVRVEVAADHLLVLEDVTLPRGDYREGDLDFYVSFGAPGAPRAFDARLLAVPDGALAPEDGDPGEPVPADRAPRQPLGAHMLLGRPQMAGAVLHVREIAFLRAVAPGGMAVLRIRSLLAPPPPPEDPQTGRELVIRLGASNAHPLTLGRVQVAAPSTRPRIARAEARLCGADADPTPLAVGIAPRPAGSPSPSAAAPLAPVLAVRHASDDLCLRYVTQ